MLWGEVGAEGDGQGRGSFRGLWGVVEGGVLVVLLNPRPMGLLAVDGRAYLVVRMSLLAIVCCGIACWF